MFKYYLTTLPEHHGPIVILIQNHSNRRHKIWSATMDITPFPPQSIQSNTLRRGKQGEVVIKINFQSFWGAWDTVHPGHTNGGHLSTQISIFIFLTRASAGLPAATTFNMILIILLLLLYLMRHEGFLASSLYCWRWGWGMNLYFAIRKKLK